MKSRKVVVATVCFFAVVVGTVAVVNARHQLEEFDPSKYNNQYVSEKGDVSFDSAVFGGNQQNSDGLELDRTQDENYNLTDGEENILDSENSPSDNFQLGVGGNTGEANENTPPVVGIGNRDPIGIHGGTSNGTNSGTGEGTGNETGAETGSETGSGTNGEISSETSGEASDEDPADETDDGIDYGVDYSTPETVISQYPSEHQDIENNITAKNLTVSGSLMMHFYPGECPRSSEMLQYITVSATMTNGDKRNNLKYCQFDGYGGDYTVTWGGERDGVTSDCVGKTPGTYKATINYRGKSVVMEYDIITWQITLLDFEESVDGFEKIDQLVYPTNSPIVDLSDAMKVMYDAMDERPKWEGYEHYNEVIVDIPDEGGGDITIPDDPWGDIIIPDDPWGDIIIPDDPWINVMMSDDPLGDIIIPDDPWGDIIIPDDPWGGDDTHAKPDFYVAYFGGWAEKEETPPVGITYKMKRPAEENIKDGVYNIEMYPVWSKTGLKPDNTEDGYYVALKKDDSEAETIWETVLIGYKDEIFLDDDESNDSESFTLTVPDGVMTVDMDILYSNCEEFGYSLDGLKSINLSKSVSKFVTPSASGTHFESLCEITADPDNQSFLSIEDVLYNKTGKELVYFPESKDSVEKWSNRVEKIGNGAFYNATVQTLSLPNTVYKFGEKAFYDASFDKLEITTDKQMQWEKGLFANGNGLTAKNLIISASKQLPVLISASESECYDFCDKMEAFFGAYDEMSIIVPDSENDGTYLAYLSMLQESLSFVDDNLGYFVLNTPDAVSQNYDVDWDGCVYTHDGDCLALVPKTEKGEYIIPTRATKIGSNAFMLCDGIEALVISDAINGVDSEAFSGLTNLKTLIFKAETAPEIKNGVFGDSIPGGLVICAGSEKDNYGPQLKDVLEKSDAVVYYGNVGGFIEDGSIYSVNSDGSYKLVLWNKNTTFANIGSNVTSIEKDAFDGCENLIAINFPQKLSQLGDSLFTGCTSLKVISFNADEAPTVSETHFDGIQSDVICFIPNEKTEEYACITNAFSNVCDAALDYDILLSGKSSVALYGNTQTASGDTDFSAIRYISGDRGEFILDKNATRIFANAFENCDNISGISGYSVERIDSFAFKNCGHINRVELASIPKCSSDAFDGCTLGLVALGNEDEMAADLSVSDIEAFNTAEELSINSPVNEISGSFEEWTSLEKFSATSDSNITLGSGLFKNSFVYSFMFAHVPECSDDTFENCFDYEVEFGTYGSCLGDLSAAGLSQFKNAGYITISGDADSLTGSFQEWNNLKEFYVYGNVAEFGGTEDENGLFEGNSIIEKVDIEGEVSTISARAFASCEALYDVYIYCADTIGEYCFAGCTELTEITFEYVGTISSYAFDGCTSLDGHGINGTEIEVLSAYAFNDCTFEEMYLQAAIVSVEKNAFAGCNELKNLILSEAQILCDGAIANCQMLESIEINGVLKIGSKAFENCPNLTEIDIYGDVIGYEDSDWFPLPLPVYNPDIIDNIAPDAFIGCDPDYVLIFVNDEMFDLYLVSESEQYEAAMPLDEEEHIGNPSDSEENVPFEDTSTDTEKYE